MWRIIYKNKTYQVWWLIPVIPVHGEAKAVELLVAKARQVKKKRKEKNQTWWLMPCNSITYWTEAEGLLGG